MTEALFYNERNRNYYINDFTLKCSFSGKIIENSGIIKISYTRRGKFLHYFSNNISPKQVKTFINTEVLEGRMNIPIHEQLLFFSICDNLPKGSVPVFDMSPQLVDVKNLKGEGMPSMLAAKLENQKEGKIIDRTRLAGRCSFFNGIESSDAPTQIGTDIQQECIIIDKRMSVSQANNLLLSLRDSTPVIEESEKLLLEVSS